ncbi:hypothetical protein LG651_12505 [Tamlana sp. 62-3]|uniref:Uncharacterized protein n=1 Tax=Neotamlana sargassicola TaxID=2883125 RepID=A0A9X1IAF9_9FLAO|nr:hypothetical protein [Tamlana sargassicola]MCB4809071.1 hypothetical protein [Tamlana sargassicola]
MSKKIKKTFKIVVGVIVFLTLPSLLFFGFLFFKYNEDLPAGKQGKQADALATKMLKTLNYQAYKNTDYIEWTFKKRHHFNWDKKNNICDVFWRNNKVILNFNNLSKSKAYTNNIPQSGENATKLIKKATTLFNNDSFWLVAPFKVFDDGVERRLVKTETNGDALLVSYTSGGSTPGDSYLWIFDENGKPKAFKIWASILPIKGLEASWSDWKTTETGAELPTFHKLLVLGLELDDIRTFN